MIVSMIAGKEFLESTSTNQQVPQQATQQNIPLDSKKQIKFHPVTCDA